MATPPTPAPTAETKQKDDRARQLVAYVESLKKCPGWTHWLSPKVTAAFNEAEKNILAAAAKGEAGNPKDILLYQTFHELMSALRQELSLAEKRIGKTPTFE